MTEQHAAGGTGADQLLARIPAEILESFTPEQVAAIRTAVAERASSGEPPVNIRFSVPLGARRAFVAVVAGADRRNATRRLTERLANPLWTGANIAFMAGVVIAVLVVAALIG